MIENSARYMLLRHVIHVIDVSTQRPLCGEEIGEAPIGLSSTANTWCAACQEKAHKPNNDLVISR